MRRRCCTKWIAKMRYGPMLAETFLQPAQQPANTWYLAHPPQAGPFVWLLQHPYFFVASHLCGCQMDIFLNNLCQNFGSCSAFLIFLDTTKCIIYLSHKSCPKCLERWQIWGGGTGPIDILDIGGWYGSDIEARGINILVHSIRTTFRWTPIQIWIWRLSIRASDISTILHITVLSW